MRIGVDLGGTKIEAIALGDDGATLLRRRVPTPSGDYQGTLQAIHDLVTGFEAELGRKGTIGIGTPGAVSPRSGLMKNSNSVVLNGRPLDRDLARLFGREIRLENDANAATWGAYVVEAKRKVKNLLCVMLGTGVDYTIFIQLALRRHGGDLKMVRHSVGRALMLCGATAMTGFGSLGMSSNPGMASLGRVCAVGIGANMLISVFLLPSWWSLIRKLQNRGNTPK